MLQSLKENLENILQNLSIHSKNDPHPKEEALIKSKLIEINKILNDSPLQNIENYIHSVEMENHFYQEQFKGSLDYIANLEEQLLLQNQESKTPLKSSILIERSPLKTPGLQRDITSPTPLKTPSPILKEITPQMLPSLSFQKLSSSFQKEEISLQEKNKALQNLVEESSKKINNLENAMFTSHQKNKEIFTLNEGLVINLTDKIGNCRYLEICEAELMKKIEKNKRKLAIYDSKSQLLQEIGQEASSILINMEKDTNSKKQELLQMQDFFKEKLKDLDQNNIEKKSEISFVSKRLSNEKRFLETAQRKRMGSMDFQYFKNSFIFEHNESKDISKLEKSTFAKKNKHKRFKSDFISKKTEIDEDQKEILLTSIQSLNEDRENSAFRESLKEDYMPFINQQENNKDFRRIHLRKTKRKSIEAKNIQIESERKKTKENACQPCNLCHLF